MFIRLMADASGVKKGTAEASKHLGGLESTVKRIGGALAGAFSVGLIARKFLAETEAAQAAMAQLTAAVKSTGGAAGLTVQQLDEMSNSMQQTTRFSDEAVKGAQALLLTFTKIKGDVFRDATVAVADLATRMGGDLQGAAIQVGKALNDPVKGITALTRVGVSFTDGQKSVIKSLVDTGRVAEAQRVILAELTTEFGGSAAAARDTLGGALEGLKNDFGELFEASRSGSNSMITLINSTAAAVRWLGEKFGEFFGGISILAVDAGIQWQKFLNIFRTSDISNDTLEAIRAEQYALILGNGKLAESFAALTPEIDAASEAEVAKAKKAMDANVSMIRLAAQSVLLSEKEGEAQVRLRIEFEALNKSIAARRDLTGELLRATLAAIEAEKKYALMAAQNARLSSLPTAKITSTSPWDKLQSSVDRQPGPNYINELRSISTPITANAPGPGSYLGDTFGALKTQVGGLAASFGPLAAAVAVFKPIFEGLMSALGPTLTALVIPLKNFGFLIGSVITPALELLTPVLEIVSMAFAKVIQGIGWLIRGVGDLLNKLPGSIGNPLKKFGQEMIDAANESRRATAAQVDLTKETESLASSMSSVPSVFAGALRRFQTSTAGVGIPSTIPGGETSGVPGSRPPIAPSQPLTFTGDITVVANNPEEFARQMENYGAKVEWRGGYSRFAPAV